jgi:protein gp37
MAKDSEIEWTHHTFNPWWGCSPVSPACKNCYAEAWAKRVGYALWGRVSFRRFFGDAYWEQPLVWNEEAKRNNIHARVFCASMADVFELRKELNEPRTKLWALIEQTPYLDWQLLTKRPQNIEKMVPWKKKWPKNVWLGTTVENQHWANIRLPFLLKHKAAVRFLSCEPLLGSIDLSSWVNKRGWQSINWVIAGGESGPNSRPMHPDWARKLRDFCVQNKIAFNFKQWGHWIPVELIDIAVNKEKTITFDGEKMIPLGKKIAGRLLDGRTYDEFPLLVETA